MKIINVKIYFTNCLFLTSHSCITKNQIASESAILESHTKIIQVTNHDRLFSTGILNSSTRKYEDNFGVNAMMQAFYWDVRSGKKL